MGGYWPSTSVKQSYRETADTALGGRRLWTGTHLEGDVFALVPDALQQGRLAVVEVQQLPPQAVVDIEQVVGVCPRILKHLLGQRPAHTHTVRRVKQGYSLA